MLAAWLLCVRPSERGTRGVHLRAVHTPQLGFNATLQAVLQQASLSGPDVAVAHWSCHIDDEFVAQLGARIDAAADAEEDYSAMWAIAEAIDDASLLSEVTDSAVDQLIETHWQRFDGIIDDEEEIFVDLHDLPDGMPRPFVGSRPSAYGEVTRKGARKLFKEMGLRESEEACFMDLGSGAGRLVAQVWLDLPDNVGRAIGIELAPSRHASAVRAWDRLAKSSELLRPGAPEFILGSMLEADLSDATHVYVASLCMGDDLLDALWQRLLLAPAVEVVATLRPFRGAEGYLFGSVDVEMTWTQHSGQGTPVYFYHMRRSPISA
ncbi:MAG: hypothetical protein SGPRY_012222 [Prymnesium sp.]